VADWPVILSRGRRYLFVHVPKTGGTSMALALEARAMKDDILVGDTPKARRRKRWLAALPVGVRIWKHSTLAEAEALLRPGELAGLFTFTLVRNPWDRVVSYYAWARAQDFPHPDIQLARRVGFEAFLDDPGVQGRLRANPAESYLRDRQGRLRASAFIRLEHFDADAAPLWRHLGFTLHLPHVNRSARARPHAAWYTPRTRNLVAELCAPDIARFGYRFEDLG
jgi:hypothetical protein